MATVAFIDCFEDFFSIIQSAELAVMQDDVEKLRDILTGTEKLTEDTYTNDTAQENILHFAVHQQSGFCVALLTGPPFNWSPDRENKFGQSALKIACKNAYLPVVYPLCSASSGYPDAMQSLRNIESLLLDPARYVDRPVTLFDIITFCGFDISSSHAFPSSDRASYSGYALCLLIELILANPELADFEIPTSDILRPSQCHVCQSAPNVSEIGTPHEILTSHVEFPACISQLFIDFSRDLYAVLPNWLWHRCYDKYSLQEESEKEDAIPPLTVLCRTMIRRHIVNSMKAGPQNNNYKNYARRLVELSLPHRLHAFLAYRDLWPTFKRHQILRLRERKTTERPHLWYLDADRLIRRNNLST